MKDNVLPFKQEKVLPVEEWGWQDYKLFFEAVEYAAGEDAAWQALYQIIKAGEPHD
jgi:hypothetical protein